MYNVVQTLSQLMLIFFPVTLQAECGKMTNKTQLAGLHLLHFQIIDYTNDKGTNLQENESAFQTNTGTKNHDQIVSRDF